MGAARTQGHAASRPRRLGYVGSIVFVDVSALAIRHLTGRFNLFHALALLSLAMVLVGIAQVHYRRRLRRWLWRHYQYMCWSYAALLAGAVNEATTRVPALRDLSASTRGALPVLASVAIVGAAAALIFANQRRLLATFEYATRETTHPPAGDAGHNSTAAERINVCSGFTVEPGGTTFAKVSPERSGHGIGTAGGPTGATDEPAKDAGARPQ